MENYQKMLARALLGQGMAGQAADMGQLQPIYRQQNMQAQMQGLPFPPFEEWLKSRQNPQENPNGSNY